MQILHEVEAVLRGAGFRTARTIDEADSLTFEDDSVLGFAAVHAGVRDIIEQWQGQQDRFLRKNAALLRRDPSKAWSTYSIFLTADLVDQHAWEMLGIEADVHATRKIVRGALITRADVLVALGPILPLSVITAGQPKGADELLAEKLAAEERTLFQLMSELPLDESRITSWLIAGARTTP
jgi:hypothetical protein